MEINLPDELFDTLQEHIEDVETYYDEINSLEKEIRDIQTLNSLDKTKTVLSGVEKERYKNIGIQFFGENIKQIKEMQEKMSFKEKMNAKILSFITPIIREYNNIINTIKDSNIFNKILKGMFIFSTIFFLISQLFPTLWKGIKKFFFGAFDFIFEDVIPTIVNIVSTADDILVWLKEQTSSNGQEEADYSLLNNLTRPMKMFLQRAFDKFADMMGSTPNHSIEKQKKEDNNKILKNYEKYNKGDKVYNFIYGKGEDSGMQNLLKVFSKKSIDKKTKNITYPEKYEIDFRDEKRKQNSVPNALQFLNDEIANNLKPELQDYYKYSAPDTLIKDIKTVITGKGKISFGGNAEEIKKMLEAAKPQEMTMDEFKDFLLKNINQAQEVLAESKKQQQTPQVKPQEAPKQEKKEEKTYVVEPPKEGTVFFEIKKKMIGKNKDFSFILISPKKKELKPASLNVEEITIEADDDTSFKVMEEENELLSLKDLSENLVSKDIKLGDYIARLNEKINILNKVLS